MATKTVRPNSTIANTNALISGAATLHAALSDDSDSSYVYTSSAFSYTGVGLPNLELPAGSLIKSVLVRIRSRRETPKSRVISAGLISSGRPYSAQTVSWGSFTTTYVAIEDAARTEAEINSEDLQIEIPVAAQVSEAYLDVNYVPKPEAEVTSPEGTISDNTTSIGWISTLDEFGGSQAYYQVKVFDDTTYGGGGFDPESSEPDYDSGIVAGQSETQDLDLPLSDDTYKAYVRVAQVVHGTVLWSDWYAGEAFTVDAPQPNSPKVTVTASDSQASLHIVISEDTDGEVDADLYQLEKSLDGGETWSGVRTLIDGGLLEPSGGDAEAWDYEVANGQTVMYRARSYSEVESSTGGWVETAEYKWESTSTWLKDPTLPELNLHNPSGCRVRSFPSQTRAVESTVHKVLGRPDPIVVRDEGGPIWESGELVLLSETASDRAAIDALVESGHTLLLQFPEGSDEPDRYIVLTGSFQRERIVNKSFASPRDETINWQEVAEPDDVVVAW